MRMLDAPNEVRVLLLPPTRRDGEAIQKILAQASLECVLCPSMPVLCAELNRGVGAILVSEESLTADLQSYVECIGKQPVWSDLSTIVLSRVEQESPKLTAALPHLGNVSVLERPVRITTLLTQVRSALRGRERQYEVRDHLVTHQRSAEEVRAGEERLRLAVETGKLGVWELDVQTAALTCSDRCKANYGRQPEHAFSYADLWNSIHPDDAERVRLIVMRTISEGVDFEIEYRAQWPDQTWHWVLVRGRPALPSARPATGLVGVTLDITERKNAEELRGVLLEAERSARSDAERAGRMKDEFLATLSHELRTPLNAILGWSQILSLKPPTESDLATGLRTIERNARAQTQIIEDLLDMSSIISGKVRLDVQRLSLAAIVQNAIDTIRPAADAKGVHVQTVLDTTAGTVSGDPNRLQQVFWNLLNNAVKFTPRMHRIQVILERVESNLEVRVIDTGDGIDATFLPHVFDRFRQADATITRRHGGLGLGLAIVKQLVELHGGKVRAASAGVGMGATFTVSIPVAPVHLDAIPPQSVARAQSTAPPSPRTVFDDISGVRVLVVDDQADSRLLVERLMSDSNAVVCSAASAREAFEMLQAERPDVLVSDVGMPDEDGLSLIRRVRKLSADAGGGTPAIALTAYARGEDRVNALRAGFQHHLAKPVDAGELIAVVASLVRKQVR